MQIYDKGKKVGFVFPVGIDTQEVLFPSFMRYDPAYAGTVTVSPAASKNLVSVVLAGDLTLNVVPSENMLGGEEVVVKVVSDSSARSVSLGTGITGPVLDTVAGKTHVAMFWYDGTAFIQTSRWVQID